MKRPAGFWIRVGATILDTIIFFIGSRLLLMFVPVTNAINNLNKEMATSLDAYGKQLEALGDNIAEVQEVMMNFVNGYMTTSANLYGASLYITVITLALGILYYIVVPFYFNGQTIGKWLAGIRIIKYRPVQEGNVKASLRDLLLRYSIAPSYGYIFTLWMIIVYFIFGNSPMSFLLATTIASIIYGLFQFVNIIIVGVTDEKRGIHELLANTKTVYVNDKRIVETTI